MKTIHPFRLLGALARNRDGNFAMLFALTALPLFLAAGLAVDVTNAFADRSEMSNALDAAVLATAKALSTGAIQQSQASDYLDKIFAANMHSASAASGSKISAVTVDGATNTVKAQATYIYRASFGVFGSAGNFPLTAGAAASYGDGMAEVAMAFDLTGSMKDRIDGWGPKKIDALKAAATLGVDQLLKANSGGETRIRIAEVPYAGAVNVGPDLAKYIYPDNGKPFEVAPDYDPNRKTGTSKGPGKGKKDVDSCATGRKGPNGLEISNDGPDKGMINRDRRLDKAGGCPSAEIVPLTADAKRLRDEIGSFTAGGDTAGHIGILWAWYMLSHKWASFMPDGSGAAAPDPKKLHKYAIIMTDGEFNTAYAGVDTSGNNRFNSVTWQPAKSQKYADELCTAMKAAGIEIFTIGFGLRDDTAKKTLQDCASPDRNGMTFFYNASSGTELATIYKQIAAMIQKLRLVS
ncbi:MAG TPA: pilus assembly protein [Pararhizobium sp.]|nr:pilus assembly protein [Pararhizobium sp.]